jgi:N-acetyl-gamma-glutamyl-phosphate reductase
MQTAVVGASGYAGSELVRLIADHPYLSLVTMTGESAAGKSVATHVPSLAGRFPTEVYESTEDVFSSHAEVVFLALPHGASQGLVPRLLEQGRVVIDLGADYRLKSATEYEEWYGHVHSTPELLTTAVYGLVERHRSELRGARLVAAPGCYPTATALALAPFIDRGVVETTGIVVNALSGVSGAGRTPSERLHFPRLHGNAEAYGLLNHRHTVEMQQELGVELLFTPHLVPVSRGMLVTAYARTRMDITPEVALEVLREAYADDPFIVVTPNPPSLKDALGSNLCFVSATVDPRTGWLVAMSSLDNLGKGAAAQAVQAANVALGFDESAGLSKVGIAP